MLIFAQHFCPQFEVGLTLSWILIFAVQILFKFVGTLFYTQIGEFVFVFNFKNVIIKPVRYVLVFEELCELITKEWRIFIRFKEKDHQKLFVVNKHIMDLVWRIWGQEESSHQLPTGSQRRIQKLAPISVARFEWNLYEWTKMCITWELNLGLGMFHWSVQLHSRTCGQVSRENCYWGMNGCLYKPWERSFNVCHSWLANSEGSSRFRVPSVQTH